MPMLIVTEEEWRRELTETEPNKEDKKDCIIIDKPKHGRKTGSVAVPDSIRAIAAITAAEGSNNKEVAEAFNISESSVSAYKHGATSTSSYNLPNSNLAPKIEKALDRIQNRARNRLNAALKSLTPERIEATKTREIAAIAKDMAAIIEKTSPKNPLVQNNNVVLYAPHQVSKDNYDVIDAPVTTSIESTQ